ncbi:uncharacterized protein LY89DRAFT_576569 [Mollisia scopiformis]|uniref:Uncharacterized protein n=1 Tax=Mollisia scopiformis TaxID=149040 RepID=A0A194XPG0_MOLSC|nr:uncharacterized protein LY89DRAFT_576569 [Mollisia scopiformis]KUJ22051.1 hypothetical protein LY89DRAFT_576569 [Mollisia scopiformis]
MGYTTVEMLLDDVSKQMASSNLSRYPRGPQGQRTGGSMRIVKPNSASNSPRGSAGLGRRRTVMNDGAYRRRLAMLEQQNAMAAGGFISNDGLQVPARSARPMSWHPASHLAPQPTYQQSYPLQTPEYQQQLQLFDMPPTPAVYSGYASPDSSFSPLSMPFNGYEQPQCSYPFTASTFQSQPQYLADQPQFITQQTQQIVSQNTNTDPTMYSHFDWNNFAANGFESSSTAPPTPDNFLPIQNPEPAFSAEESIPYEPLEDPESGGEELIGMGLYDSPDTVKTSSLDPQLDNYRALMMSHLMGSGHRKTESTGKGLKLEETWEPPASDDEDADDEEQDGEGEDEEVEEAPQALAGWL